MAFILTIGGIPTAVVIYPGQNIIIKTTLPAPCDCLQIFFNTNNPSIYVGLGCD
jgi:hypothetical protein